MKQISYEELKNTSDGTLVTINGVLCKKQPDGVTYTSWYGSTEFCSWKDFKRKDKSLTIFLW